MGRWTVTGEWSQVITVLLILGERTGHDDFAKHLGKFSDINVCIRIK